MTKNKQQKTTNKKKPLAKTSSDKLPFIEHVYELRRRLFYVIVSVLVVAALAYSIQQRIVNFLLAPSHGQHFIYTSPGGGINFLFSICLYTGLAFSVPVIIYQLLRYLEPLFKDSGAMRFVVLGSIASGILAVAGMAFGYYVGLPSVLNFLFHQFTTTQVQPLVTIQSYISFVRVYMLGSALLFQVPLILLFINRIKPLKPSTLFHYERWVILGAFVASGLMNPTINILSQLLVAGPIILMYQVGIAIIWQINRHRRRSPRHSRDIQAMLERDARAQAMRGQAASSAVPAYALASSPASKPSTSHALATKQSNLSPANCPPKAAHQKSLAPKLAPTASSQYIVVRQSVKPLPRRSLISDFRTAY